MGVVQNHGLLPVLSIVQSEFFLPFERKILINNYFSALQLIFQSRLRSLYYLCYYQCFSINLLLNPEP